MHRSGTSLLSSFLNINGVNMGEKLVGPAKGNEKGHFEDEYFVNLHDSILKDNHQHIFTSKKHFIIHQNRKLQAQQMIQQNIHERWGWKDPRSSLFLDLWESCLNAKEHVYIFLYRNPYDVIDSIFRRGAEKRIKLYFHLPAISWINYNETILEFIAKTKIRYRLINIDAFNQNQNQGVRLLEDLLGMKFNYSYKEVFDPSSIKTKSECLQTWQQKASKWIYGLKIEQVYNKLNKLSDITINDCPYV